MKTHTIIPVQKPDDIPPAYRGTPIGALLEYHNLERSFDTYSRAALLIGMCMDHRQHLRVPEKFAYILRAGGANLRHHEFYVSYAVAVCRMRHIALIGHDGCGMVNLTAKKTEFIEGLVASSGWSREAAEEHFSSLAARHEIGNEANFIAAEAGRLSRMYPGISIAPLYYRLEDQRLYCLG